MWFLAMHPRAFGVIEPGFCVSLRFDFGCRGHPRGPAFFVSLACPRVDDDTEDSSTPPLAVDTCALG